MTKEEAEKIKRYCEICGTQLKVEIIEMDIYNIYSGKKRLVALGTCPNWKRTWWSGSNGHEHNFTITSWYDGEETNGKGI